MTRGRRPLPIEVKRRRGTLRADRLPVPLASIPVLPMVEGEPEPPVELGAPGRRLWHSVWTSESRAWVSPDSDMTLVISACQLADVAERARQRFAETDDPRDGRAINMVSDRLMRHLSALGLTPSARARLGIPRQ